MESSTSPRARPAAAAQFPQYAGREEVRRAIHVIVLRVLVHRLGRLTKDRRRRARRQAAIVEDFLYRHASCLEEYQEPSTLAERVLLAGRAVCVDMQRREAEGRAVGR